MKKTILVSLALIAICALPAAARERGREGGDRERHERGLEERRAHREHERARCHRHREIHRRHAERHHRGGGARP